MFPWSSDADKIQRAAEKFRRATKNDDVATARALLKNGKVDINGPDKNDGWTPLYVASVYGRFEIVELLLKAKVDPNVVEQNGWTQLYTASYRGYSRIVELLLKAKADPNAANTNGRRPLHGASEKGHRQVVELLLKAKADPNATNKDGNTPLHAARDTISWGCEVVQALLLGGADLHAKNNDGLEPLHVIIKSHSHHEVGYGTLTTLQTLVSFGATWDDQCDAILEGKIVPALRLCLLLWAQEHKDGLPFAEVPREVVQRGLDSTQAYINAVKTSCHIVLRRKICLVGSSCAGKTTFVKSITSELLQPQLEHLDERTIGIDHFPLRFEQPVVGSKQVKVHEVTFWDFAGQDAYQVAHSLFFSPRTLFLVFVDLEAFAIAYMQAVIVADEGIQEAKLLDEFVEEAISHWIRLILARQPDAEFVFLATKEDLLNENTVTENLLKDKLMEKLQGVGAVVEQMKKAAKQSKEKPNAGSFPDKNVGVTTTESRVVFVIFVSCTSLASIRAARTQVEELITKSKLSVPMPDTYTKALEAIVKIREEAKALESTKRIDRVFHAVDTLPDKLQIQPELCRIILQTLHDLGDVLWFEDMGVDLFENTVILDPLLLIDFIRQVITHKHTGVTIPHSDLKSKPFWMGLTNQQQLKAMKQVLQKFHLVYPDDEYGVMNWDSDLIVSAFWQTKIRAVWMFLGDILRINSTQSRGGEASRLHWEFHFEFGLPSSLFDQVVVASVSPFVRFDAGPDWIVYKEKGIAACRLMVSRDRPSLHRTIRVEAVVAEAATKKQADNVWLAFQQLCGAFVRVLREHRGLAVSSFAWDDANLEVNLKRLVQSESTPPSANWMPPPETWEWFKPRFLALQQVEAVMEAVQLEEKLAVAVVVRERKVAVMPSPQVDKALPSASEVALSEA